MHPILREIFLEPVGWLAIGGSLVMLILGLALGVYVRCKVRAAVRATQQQDPP
ncbi:hypothetical protein [Lysobacter sp.]|uniref:hypothetical protein n=1 Tax=Lysobacter sp. TaxID=72226 RepID=UPI002D31BB15|nr:hypothetical protein [Lysobacter sp.]HZX77310.1 hypothetical protein [Lysobacter sp.]